MAHAHGEFLHGDLWQAQSINSFCQFTQLPEVRAHLFRVSPPGRQGHQALDAEVRQRCDLASQVDQGLSGGAPFALLFAQVDLEENVDTGVVLAPLTIYLFCQGEAINRVNHGHFAAQVFNLVGLQRADKVPFDLAADLINLGNTLLHIAFSEQPLPGACRSLYVDSRLFLGDGYQPHACRVTLAPLADGCNAFRDSFDVVCDIHKRSVWDSKKFYCAEFFKGSNDFTEGNADDIGIAAFNPGDHEGTNPLDCVGASLVKGFLGGNVPFNFLTCQILEKDFGGDR